MLFFLIFPFLLFTSTFFIIIWIFAWKGTKTKRKKNIAFFVHNFFKLVCWNVNYFLMLLCLLSRVHWYYKSLICWLNLDLLKWRLYESIPVIAWKLFKLLSSTGALTEILFKWQFIVQEMHYSGKELWTDVERIHLKFL